MPMMMQCPFYKKEKSPKLYCEGCILKFPDTLSRAEYIRNFCANNINWTKCSVAHNLQIYYDRKDEE